MKIQSFFGKLLRELLAPASDPRLSYEATAARHELLIARVGQARQSLASARARLEARLSDVKRRRTEVPAANLADPFEQQLSRLVSDGVADLEAELVWLIHEDEELKVVEERLASEAQAIRVRHEAREAHDIVSQAKSQVQEQLAGLAGQSRWLATLTNEVERRAEGVEGRLAATSSLMAFAAAPSGEAQTLAMRYIASARAETYVARKDLLASGFRCLLDLDSEHDQLQALTSNANPDGVLSNTYIQALATETYQMAVRLLDDALGLIKALPGSEPKSPPGAIPMDSRRSGRTLVVELLDQTEQCVAALRQTRQELATAAAAGAARNAEVAAAALRRAADDAKGIQEELNELGL